MIRFIDLGRQIAVDENDPSSPRQFAFFNTVDDQFVRVNGTSVFDSYADLIQEIEQDEAIDGDFATRLVRLCPNGRQDQSDSELIADLEERNRLLNAIVSSAIALKADIEYGLPPTLDALNCDLAAYQKQFGGLVIRNPGND